MENGKREKTGERQVNLELLRIVSMLLIVLLHSIDHSGVLEATETGSPGIRAYIWFAYALTQVGVNCYVLISGYFLIESRFRIQKLVVLWMEVAFYSFLLKAIFMIAGITPFSVMSLLSCLFPVFTGRYWFITIYFGLYLLSPFLNLFIHAMNKKQHTILNVLLLCLFSIWISIHPSIAGMNSGGGWGLAWFVVLYLAASWFRLYDSPTKNPWIGLAVWFAVAMAMAMAFTLCTLGRFPVLQQIVNNWWRYDSLPVYVMSLAFFISFLNLEIHRPFWKGLIRVLASSTLGVYLIHAHAQVSPWSWEVFDLPSKMEMAVFPLIQILVVILIYVVCTWIDLGRRYTVGRLEHSTGLKALCEQLTQRVNRCFEKVIRTD